MFWDQQYPRAAAVLMSNRCNNSCTMFLIVPVGDHREQHLPPLRRKIISFSTYVNWITWESFKVMWNDVKSVSFTKTDDGSGHSSWDRLTVCLPFCNRGEAEEWCLTLFWQTSLNVCVCVCVCWFNVMVSETLSRAAVGPRRIRPLYLRFIDYWLSFIDIGLRTSSTSAINDVVRPLSLRDDLMIDE